MKKTHFLKIKDHYIKDYANLLKKSEAEAKVDLNYSADIVKIGLDEYVRYQDKLIPVLEFFERVEIEKEDK